MNKNNTSPMMTQNQSKQLLYKIQIQRKTIRNIEQRTYQIQSKIKKVVESNERNDKRLLRHRARLQQLKKCKQSPQILLAFSGIMNEYVQAFMISHNFEMNIDITNMNPDNMSYERLQQLIELGQKIGKVSKGLNKQQIQKLEHIRIKIEQTCPICCNQFKINEMGIKLKCKHIYHQECILEWLKDQNICPICKQYVLLETEKAQQEQ